MLANSGMTGRWGADPSLYQNQLTTNIFCLKIKKENQGSHGSQPNQETILILLKFLKIMCKLTKMPQTDRNANFNIWLAPYLIWKTPEYT